MNQPTIVSYSAEDLRKRLCPQSEPAFPEFLEGLIHHMSNLLQTAVTSHETLGKRIGRLEDSCEVGEFASNSLAALERVDTTYEKMSATLSELEPYSRVWRKDSLEDRKLSSFSHKVETASADSLRKAQQKRIELLTHVSASPDQHFVWWRFERIVSELVNNAVAASSAGSDISVVVRQEENLNVEILVTDRGCGMSPDKLAKCINPFYGDRGTGLGLTVVAACVSCLSGHLQIKSELNSGTRIKVTLPLGEAQDRGT